MSRMKFTLSSAKQKLFYMVQQIGRPGKEHPSVSSSVAPYEPTSLRVNLYNAELENARALMWWQMWDRTR